MRMGNLLLKFHLYSGLICFWYLLILGLSALNFNHHFPFMQSHGKVTDWTKTVQLSNTFHDDLKVSEALRDSLSLIGWPLPWETYRDSTGIFHFSVEQPGKRYVISYSFNNRIAQVQESRKGFWQVVNALHGSGGVPNSVVMEGWTWYTRLTIVLVLFSLFLGISMWYRGIRDKKAGRYILVGSTLLTIAWMLELYFIG
jgi:hypothetical protein